MFLLIKDLLHDIFNTFLQFLSDNTYNNLIANIQFRAAREQENAMFSHLYCLALVNS